MLIREPRREELPTIYRMGHDAWGSELSDAEYQERCKHSAKYPQGTWYVLEKNGELVSSLIVYRSGFELPEGCWGIGSVATPPALRGNGYAPRMLNHVLDLARAADARALYLFSGIDPAYYAKFGFELVPDAPTDLPGVCMALCFRDSAELHRVVPAYF
jgi:N-acetylglutamate synthase-like GNAT family acetyltransferase